MLVPLKTNSMSQDNRASWHSNFTRQLNLATFCPPPTPASRDAPCPGKAEGEKEPEAYPLRYVENSFDLRTKPGAMLCDQ